MALMMACPLFPLISLRYVAIQMPRLSEINATAVNPGERARMGRPYRMSSQSKKHLLDESSSRKLTDHAVFRTCHSVIDTA